MWWAEEQVWGGYLATLRTLPNIYKPSPRRNTSKIQFCAHLEGFKLQKIYAHSSLKNEMILIAGLSVSLRMNIA